MSVTLLRLSNFIEEFRKVDSEMQAQTMLTLLYVARMEKTDKPATIKDVGEYLGVTSASASRNVASLAQWSRHQRAGHDLIEANEDPSFRSQKLITLTSKGRRFIKTLEDNYGRFTAGE